VARATAGQNAAAAANASPTSGRNGRIFMIGLR
jgi:hypothetical protein